MSISPAAALESAHENFVAVAAEKLCGDIFAALAEFKPRRGVAALCF